MTTFLSTLLVLAATVAIPAAGRTQAAQPAHIQRARAVLIASARAYQAVPALRDSLTYVLKAPNAEREPKKVEIRLGAGRDVGVGDALLQAFAVGPTLYLTKAGVADKYVARAYDGDFRKTLETISGGQGSLFEPAQVGMRLGKDLGRCIDDLRFNQLGPLQIARYGQIKDARGRGMDEIQFTAENGWVVARLDRRTHFFSTVRMNFRPPGAPSNVVVEIEGEFSPQVLKDASGVVGFDPRNRRPVANLADLDSDNLPVGQRAPQFVLETPDGKQVSMANLGGRVVVLDFWATWCAPCWTALGEAQRLSEWASARGLPVTVLAVNALDQFPTNQERSVHVRQVFQSRGLKLVTLIDHDGQVFQSFGSPGLPSTVVISRQGTILKYHQGLEPNMADTLQAEVTQALTAP